MWFRSLFSGRRSTRRSSMTVQLFRSATLHRNAGRYEEAATLVREGLELDPNNVVGLLLAGSLHAVFRETELAQTAFERVLTIDPTQPRALLGMARTSLEIGEAAVCAEYLRRALGLYPDFPEARALLEAVSHADVDTAPRPGATQPFRVERLRVPPEIREALLARVDATLIFAHPRAKGTEEVAAHTARLCRLTSGMLARCGLKRWTHAVVEGAAETTFLRADEEIVLSLVFGRDIDMTAGLAHLDRVWTNCRQELAAQVAS
jgi:tetratricopeptide (TPR) repeat protein